MISLQSVILTLAVAYAAVGALLLIVLVYARLHWSLKAIVIVVTSAFYFVSFGGMRGLLGWASAGKAAGEFQAAVDADRGAAFVGGRSGLDLSLG